MSGGSFGWPGMRGCHLRRLLSSGGVAGSARPLIGGQKDVLL